ncbi:transcriptional regulator GcvA [Gymnodinialimonas ceratoperidinii]|uniref:Transcriptional regulator GcvA n=1 Tax=Gymnodinialimonas ceratoperidinii TaxID=2856823 RepID=A0A8F6TXH5_9RHOB|nr:transcriptional regulator GcvA [Gymnodinialimonas ceratoperidinii]QXT39738.1 transcriptional regulator GcvA [Gymnodinialimonas ceratoperidinii]
MSDRLPPLTALRAFDAAARHLSFAKAAAELNVTPAALSFQIKSLEQHLEAPLFRRLNRAVELTDAGRALCPGAADGFAALTSAWRAAKRTVEQKSLIVTAGPAFTAKWLAPRLFKFATLHPEIELRFSATLRLVDFSRDDVDVAIRFGLAKEEPGLYTKPIIREWVAPMMTPELAAQYPEPADLSRAPLLHQDDIHFLKPAVDWPAWFRAADLPPRFAAGARFSQADHAIDAALAGAGVVLGRISLAEKDLREGRLVMPYKLGLTTEAEYSFVCPEGPEARPQVRAFREWIEAEIVTLKEYGDEMKFVDAAEVQI